MRTIADYASPIGKILLCSDEKGLIGLWFYGQKYFASLLGPDHHAGMDPILEKTAAWLDAYFSGSIPREIPPLHMIGTSFQIDVWKKLLQIPYGTTTTYGDIAKMLARERNLPHMSAQAVGGAVGHNPVSLIIPCHRVIGADGKITGYAGGTDKKEWLLAMEEKNR